MDARRLSDLLDRLANVLRAAARADLGDRGLLPVHLQALSYLSRANRYSDSPAGVTEYLGATKGTVSQTLRLLVRRGLLNAGRDAGDRRRVHLALTPAGEDLVRTFVPPRLLRSLAGEGAGEGTGEGTRERDGTGTSLEDGLEHLLRGVQRVNGLRTFGACPTCRLLLRDDGGAPMRCGLTREALSEDDTRRICREHQEVDAPERA